MHELQKEEDKQLREKFIEIIKRKPFPTGFVDGFEEIAVGTFINEEGKVLNFGEQLVWDADITEIEKLPTHVLADLVFSGLHEGDIGWDLLMEWKKNYNDLVEDDQDDK